MSFEYSSAFWLLALAIPVVVLHLVQVRIKRLRVPTLHFWKRVQAEDPKRTALKKVMHHASLAIHLSILLLATLAISVPTLQGCTPPSRQFLILIDNSPSMGVVEKSGRNRFDMAKAEVRKIVSGFGRRDKVILMDLALDRTPMTSDHGTLMSWLDRLPLRSDSVPIQEALTLAHALIAPGTLVLISDGNDTPSLASILEREDARWIPVGTERDNVGIISCQFEQGWDRRIVTLFMRIKNSGQTAKDVPVEVTLQGKPFKRWTAHLDPGHIHSASIPIDVTTTPRTGASVVVSVEPSDAFPQDNKAVGFLRPPRVPALGVYYHGEKPPEMLERLIHLLGTDHAIALESSFVADVDQYAKMKDRIAAGPILVFYECLPPETVQEGRIILIDPPGDYGPMHLGEKMENIGKLSTARTHPVLEWVDLGSIRIKAARGVSWLESAKGTAILVPVDVPKTLPVAALATEGSLRLACFAFSMNLDNTDLLLHPTFPILFRNVLIWLSEGDTPLARASERPGYRTWRIDQPGDDITPRTEDTVLDERETDIAPVAAVSAPFHVDPVAYSWFQDYQFDVIAAILVLGLLILEFLLYHRGYL